MFHRNTFTISSKFRISQTYHGPVSPSALEGPNLSKPVGGLLNLLNDKQVEIDRGNSERVFKYEICGEMVSSRLPLEYEIPPNSEVTAILLREKNLRIFLKKFHSSHGTPPEVYGPCDLTSGIECHVALNGGTVEDLGKVKRIKEVIQDFYAHGLDRSVIDALAQGKQDRKEATPGMLGRKGRFS